MLKKATLSALVLSAVLSTSLAVAAPGMHGHGHGPALPPNHMMHEHMKHNGGHEFMSLIILADADRNGALDANEQKTLSVEAQKRTEARLAAMVDFSKADLDKNGYVTLDEINKLILEPIALPVDPNADTNKEAYGHKDRNHNNKNLGKHGHREGPQHQKQPKNPAYGLMKKYDADLDLRLNQEEYANLYQHETNKIKLCGEAYASLKDADLNKDGLLSMPEIHNAHQRVMLKAAPNFKKQPR